MKLTQNHIQILEEGRIEENRFYIKTQLDRKQYLSINEVLETIGFKRNRKQKAHIADGLTENQLEEAISDIIESGEVETLKETIKKFQFYETPREVAEYLIELADLQEDDLVCEPSAGHGAIADCIDKKHNLKCFELDPKKVEILKEKGYNVEEKDRLQTMHNGFDKIIANPPFSKSQDVKHILRMHSQLRGGGRLVSVASSSIQTRQGKLYDEFRDLNPEFIELPPGSFKDSGTMVNTVVVLLNK